MQEIVDAMNRAAEDGGSFGRIEDHLIESAKKDDYPLHYAWERSGTFTQEFRRSQAHDTDATASFAIVARQDNYTYDELETLFKGLVGRARSQKKGLEPVDFDAFGAHFGGTKVRLVIYEMRLDTNTQF
jgi:hypothetical protein